MIYYLYQFLNSVNNFISHVYMYNSSVYKLQYYVFHHHNYLYQFIYSSHRIFYYALPAQLISPELILPDS